MIETHGELKRLIGRARLLIAELKSPKAAVRSRAERFEEAAILTELLEFAERVATTLKHNAQHGTRSRP